MSPLSSIVVHLRLKRRDTTKGEFIQRNVRILKHGTTIRAKSPGTLCLFLFCTKHSSPPPPKQYWFLGEVHGKTSRVQWLNGKTSRVQWLNGKTSRVQWLHVSQEQNNIVIWGKGVRSTRNDLNTVSTICFTIFYERPTDF